MHKIGYDNIILRETNANIRNIIYWQACGVLGRIAGHAATISDIDRLALNMRYPQNLFSFAVEKFWLAHIPKNQSNLLKTAPSHAEK